MYLVSTFRADSWRIQRLMKLSNCTFQVADARDLPFVDGGVDAIITSRLFMMLDRKEDATGEIFRVLRPGGFFFIAEPLSAMRAKIPLAIMKSLGRLMWLSGKAKWSDYDNDIHVQVLTPEAFSRLVHSQPWERVVQWQSHHYQYAVCSKGLTSRLDATGLRGASAPNAINLDFVI
jgi:ubiquinone/menaquinone biosynthesis C-methylase UbiE